MKISKMSKRVIAVLMAVLMLVGMLPTDFMTATAKAAEPAAPNVDTGKAYVLDASTLTVADFGGTFATALTADLKCGTDDFFTVYSVGSKNSLWTTGNKLPEGGLKAPNGTYTQAVNLGGGMKNTGQAAIGFTIEAPAKVIVYDAVKAENATKHHFQYAKAGGSVVTYCAMENDTSVVNKIELDLDEAGTYYIGGNNGGNILYVEVQYKLPEYSLDGGDASAEYAALFNPADAATNPNCLIADTTINGYFSVTTAGNKVKRIAGQSINYGGNVLTTSLRLDGSPNWSKKQATVEFTALKDFRLTIVGAQKGSKVPALKYTADGGTTVVDLADAKFTTGVATEYSVNLPAGTYQIGAQNGLDIFEMNVKYVESFVMDANKIDPSLVAETDETKLAVDTQLGTDGFLTALAVKNKIAIIKKANTFNDVAYNNSVRLTGGAKVGTGQACLKVTLAKSAKITIYAAAKGASGENTAIGYAKVGDSALTPMGKLGATDAINEYTVSDLKPGDYYIGSASGADIYYLSVEYDPMNKQVVPWEEVAAPVIDKVTVNEDGNFVVDFTATIDKYDGAEYVAVTMYADGKEVETQRITAQTSQAIMTPLANGNYTFKATAVRVGEAFKESNIVEQNNYTLAVRKPVIVMEQNRGNGQYYIDWFNLSEADYYTVQIKSNSEAAAEYTTVADNLTNAHYLLTNLDNGSYSVQIIATRSEDGYIGKYSKDITVSDDASPKWYVATFGSAQSTHAVITEADNTQTKIDLDSSDTANPKTNIVAAPDITNTAGKISLAASTSGKISDGEEGFSYYYTYVDPNTENFKISAKFTINELLGPDNQTGFGIMATDMPGLNFYGAPDYYHKLYNEVSTIFWVAKAPRSCLRYVTGYWNPDTSNSDGVERVMTEKSFTSDTNLTFTIGKEVEFSIEKTNDKYIVTCNGQSQELNDTSLLSVQEDGSMCIGVMTSRKVGVEISEITYTTSESTGVSGAAKDDRIAPHAEVFSSGTSGSKSYEYTYAANTAGNLVVKCNGKEIANRAIAANEVVRIPAYLKSGTNTLESEFTPSGTLEELTNTDVIKKSSTVECKQYGVEGETIVVAPDGTAAGEGTSASPLDIATAVQYVQPGQTILLKNGTYTTGARINRSVSGRADAMITMIPETVGGVVFDGAGLSIIGSYWHVYGIEVKDVKTSVGIQIAGNNNIVEMCTVHGSANSGIQISRSGSANNIAGIQGRVWPSDNLVKNCESYDNCDPGRNDADGFAAKLTCGEGNRFYGCIGHHNIDDGWDLFAKTISGEIGSVTIENCVAYNNGWLTTDDTTAVGYNYGEGNGFKLGGGYLKGGHVLRNSISFANGAKGVTSNSCPDCEIYNTISYGNGQIPVEDVTEGAYNVGLNKKAADIMDWKVSGLISMADPKNTAVADLIPFSLNDATNYIYNGDTSWNSQGVQAVDDWFVNVDMSVAPARNEDGTINMHGLLELTQEAPADTGARLDVTSDAAKSVKPEATAEAGTTPVVKKQGLTLGEDGQWHLFVDGEVDDTYTGLASNEHGWFYVKNGDVDWTHNGVEGNEHGWWKVTNGKVDFGFTGLASNMHGWWYLVNGKVDFTHNGVEGNENGWWKVTNGKVDFGFTGLASNMHGWWYLVDGKVDFTHNGVEGNENGWWKVTDGKVDFGFTGLANNMHGWWYLVNGKVDFTYNGTADNENGKWKVVNGKVTAKAD